MIVQVVVGIERGVGRVGVDVAQVQPVVGKGGDECVGLGVIKQPVGRGVAVLGGLESASTGGCARSAAPGERRDWRGGWSPTVSKSSG